MAAELQSILLQRLGEADYARFHDLARTLTGMVFGAHRRPELERAVMETLQLGTGIANLDQLYDLLQQAPISHPARITFVRHLAVGETHFFRNKPQFSALTEHILPEIIERRRALRQLRIWSAGCSTGEEPYSLAILLEHLLPDLDDWNVLILATDINHDALERAQRGVYGAWSFRQAPPAVQSAYFTAAGRNLTLIPRIRQRVTFAYLNLAGANYPLPLTNTTHMDLILCRNVLIYFPRATTHHVVGRLHGALSEDGWLIVGHAEPSQEVFHQYTHYNFPDTVVYRKQSPARGSLVSAQPVHWPEQVSDVSQPGNLPPVRMPVTATYRQLPALQQPAVPSIRQLNPPPRKPDDRYAAALALAAAGKVDEASRQLMTLAAPPVNDGAAAFHLAQVLAGCGRLADAERWVQVALEHTPLLAEAHYLHSLLLLEAGRPDAALAALRRCLYADAGFELAHFSLAGLFQQQKHPNRALRELQLTANLLQGQAEAEPLRGGDGLSVGRLRQLVKSRTATLTAIA